MVDIDKEKKSENENPVNVIVIKEEITEKEKIDSKDNCKKQEDNSKIIKKKKEENAENDNDKKDIKINNISNEEKMDLKRKVEENENEIKDSKDKNKKGKIKKETIKEKDKDLDNENGNKNENNNNDNTQSITKKEAINKNDTDYDSDISIETLSSFTSSDLNIDSEVEARLNNKSSKISIETEDCDDKKILRENNLLSSSQTDDISKKIKNNKKKSKKEKKKEKKKEHKDKKVDKNKNENTDENITETSTNPKISQNNNSSSKTKIKNKRNIDEIPDNEIVELKNRRVIFHEKKIQIDTLSETLIELLCFHEFRNTQVESITKVPERFNSLIAKLVQDSDASENSLSYSVFQSLNPTDEDEEDDSILLRSAVSAAIRNVAVRKNYGIEKEGSYYPNLAIFRWEVKNLEWLPKPIQEKIKLRRKIRERASDILKKIVDNMSEEEKTLLFRSKKRKPIIAEENKTNDTEKEAENTNEQKAQNNNKTEEKEKNEKTAELLPKENDKRKLDQIQGQRSISGFFSPIKRKKIEEKVIPETIQEKQNMEFDNRFKSFYIKSNTKIAPLNYFNDIKAEYNFDKEDKMSCDEDVSLDHYLSIIKERKIKNIIKKRKEEKQKLIDSDIVDLTDGNALPQYKMKLLQFFENHRPAYYGTWRKETKVISGRHPFKKDTELLDYEFDSEIEWVADEEGEECLSDEEDEEEDMIDAQDEQGEDDDWLVPHGYLSDDEGVEEDIEKINKMDKKNEPKPMKIVPLIPVIIGPIYAENSYDEIPENINLAQFTTQLLDPDMDFPLDPFKEYPQNDDITSNNNLNEENDKKLKITPFPEEHLSIFVKIVQYSLKGMVKIIDEAKELEEFKNIPKIQIEKKLREIAVKEKPEGVSKICWCIKDEIYQKLNMEKPEIPDSLKIEKTITSPKRNKSIFKNIKSPVSNGDNKKKQTKEPMLNFLPKKKTITTNNISPKKTNVSPKKTDNTIIIDLENDN
ncbi:hypothetical protein BCR36DRAFT_585035 [Piromyces finnis]|uniref:Chromatin assembly factor 1 subunit A n=1 Tax=Piromyces finnis TaxID=1754191 RepID=A0A1Y1V4D1_9FUNG|nr:hypothetical protein BCR36DRAFT_585035 [Piromyces finnis]|eukprot:ORX46927.1 hypothetical protein BCR36DRAFT_585035 [Piromyces finnis]